MARKVVNRKELREEAEAAEKIEKKKKKAAPKKKAAKKKAAKKKTTKRKSRAAAEVRLKAFWGVFNQSLRRVHLFEYHDRKLADKKAADLSTSSKSPHFVQLVKEAVDDVD